MFGLAAPSRFVSHIPPRLMYAGGDAIRGAAVDTRGFGGCRAVLLLDDYLLRDVRIDWGLYEGDSSDGVFAPIQGELLYSGTRNEQSLSWIAIQLAPEAIRKPYVRAEVRATGQG
jgi:hypothetical protein